MKPIITMHILCTIFQMIGNAQVDASYLQTHAVCFERPEELNTTVYTLLDPYQYILFGEVHGTNESAAFVYGLANLFTNKGDSVLVGLEIPSNQMNRFIRERTDSSIYHSAFFTNPTFVSGRESYAWAKLISALNNNLNVKLFFFDIDENESKPYLRDSLMYAKIKTQIRQHPGWRLLTLSGNFHNKTSDQSTMASWLKQDKELNLSSRLCLLNMEYLQGTCMANFGHGLERKQLGQAPRTIDKALDCNHYFVLCPPNSYYEYTGYFYTKYITAARMTTTNTH